MPELRPITEAERGEADAPDVPEGWTELPEATLSDAVVDIVKHKFALGLADAAENIIALAGMHVEDMMPADKRVTLDAAKYVIEFNVGKPEGHGKDDPLDKLLKEIENDGGRTDKTSG